MTIHVEHPFADSDPVRRLRGRLAVAESVRGCMVALGGRVALTTGPGLGTEWELHWPR